MRDQLQADLKQAMINKDVVRVSTLRILMAEIKNLEISKGQDLAEGDFVSLLQKEAKKRREAAAGFRSGGREESALIEEKELAVIEGYLPKQMSDEELTAIVENSINELGATSIKDMGKVIGLVMGKVAGQADGQRVSGLIKEKLVG
jgi:uncharacterized protein